MDICEMIKYNIQHSHSSHENNISCAFNLSKLYSYMHFLDLSLYEITFIELYTVCLLSTFTIPD